MVKRSPVELLHAGTVQLGQISDSDRRRHGGGRRELSRRNAGGAERRFSTKCSCRMCIRRSSKRSTEHGRLRNYESLVVLETSTIAAIVRATDAAVKGAQVEVAELRLGNGLGGRGLAILTGERTDVEAAAEIAGKSLAGRNVTLCHSIISNVHEQFAAAHWQNRADSSAANRSDCHAAGTSHRNAGCLRGLRRP